MDKFELSLLYKNDTGNTVPELAQTWTYEDEKSNLLEDIKDTLTIIAQLSYCRLNEVKDKIKQLEDKVEELKTTVEDLNSDIDISLDENSRDYVEWLQTKIK